MSQTVVTTNTVTDIVEVTSRGPAGPGGARGNYGSFYDTTDQAIVTANVGQRLRIASVIGNLNVDLVDNKIIFRDGGIYSMTFSVQLINVENNAVHGARIWLKYQGSAYPNSASYIAVPGARGGTPGEIIATVNFVAPATGDDDYVEVFWTAESTNVSVATIDATGSIPAAPGVILTVTQVMYMQTTTLSSINATPQYTGQMAVVGGQGYIAVGTTGTADWKQIT